MLFREYKDKMFLKNIEEIVINKTVKIRGKEVLFLSFVKGEKNNQLWTVRKIENNISEEEMQYHGQLPNTNREELKRHIIANSNIDHFHISQMNIQNNIVNFVGYQGTPPNYAYGEQLQMIRHFIESGLISDEFDDVDVEKIAFTCYEQAEDEVFPIVNDNEEINITLHVTEETKEKLIEWPLSLKIGVADKGTKIFYKDSDGNEDFFYLNEVIKYDIWQDTLEKIEANINNVPEDLRESYREDALEGLSNLCPKEKDATAIYYENKENIQLRFLSKEYLGKKPLYNSGCFGMISDKDDKIGINGYYKYVDMLYPVNKDFQGDLEIELFSKYEKIPGEIISFKL